MFAAQEPAKPRQARGQRGLLEVDGAGGALLFDADDNVYLEGGDDWGSCSSSDELEDGDDSLHAAAKEREWGEGYLRDFFASRSDLRKLQQTQRQARRECYESLLARETHCEKCHSTNIRKVDGRMVTLLCAGGYTMDIEVPVFGCSGRAGCACGYRWHRQAAAIGFFPTTLSQALQLHRRSRHQLPLLWMDVDLLQLLLLLQHRSPQLAVKACCEALAMKDGVEVSAQRLERLMGPTLDRYRAHAYVMRRNGTLGCHDYPPEQGVLGVCSARCHLAGTPDEEGNIRPLGDVQLDACMGLRRRAGAATKANAQRTEPIVVERCFPVNEADGLRLHPGVEGIRRGGREFCDEIQRVKAAAGEQPPTSCSTFKAATDVPDKQRRHDQTGLFGMFCIHGFCLGGAFMHEGEKYAYAAMMLQLLGLTHGCRILRAWYATQSFPSRLSV